MTIRKSKIDKLHGPLLHDDHKAPVTRRDFLSQGLISGAGLAMAPSLLSMLATSGAHAATLQECGVTPAGGSGRVPFLAFDLAGGANIAGSNAMVGGQGGQLDFITPAGYDKLGLPSNMLPNQNGQLNMELGMAFHADSAFLRGIKNRASAATLANVNGTIICARSDNDTGNNPHNPMYGIAAAGAKGDLVALVGSRNSESGGRSRAPMSMIDPTVRPTKVDRPSDATGLVDAGKLNEVLSGTEAARVMAAVSKLSELKLDRVTQNKVLKDLVHCGYLQSADKVSRFGNPAILDPTMDPLIANSIFSAAELGNGDFRKTASVMKLVIDGFAGAGTVELGGYDYHNSTRARGEIADFKAGECMGAALEYAASKQQPLMIYTFSDGSVASNGQIDNSNDGRGKGIWRGDNSSTAASLILVYNPAGRPQTMTPTSNQIGHFRPDGSVETAAHPGANNVDLLTEMVVLNYLALHNEIGKMAMVLPNHGLGPDLDKFVGLQPIKGAA